MRPDTVQQLPVRTDARLLERVVWGLPVAMALVVLIALPLLRTREATGGTQMTLDRTIFMAIDAVTMTGFRLAYVNPNDFKPLGQAILFILTAGGTLVTWIVCGLAVARIARMPFTLTQIVRGALLTWVLSIIVASNLLMGQGNGLWEAVYQASSAVGNFGGAIGQLPTAYDWQTHAVVLPLALLGTLGIPVILDIMASGFSYRRLHGYSRLVLLTTAAVYVIGLVLIAWTYWMPGLGAARTLVVSSTESLDARSLGMPLVALRELPRASVWVVLALMIIGGNPAGASGGVTGVGLTLLGRDTLRLMSGQRVSPFTGYLLAWVGGYLVALFVLVLMLLYHAPQLPGDEALFLVVSALGTVGRSSEPLTNTGMDLHILSLAMAVGRVFPMVLLWWMLQASEVDQPELRTDCAQ